MMSKKTTEKTMWAAWINFHEEVETIPVKVKEYPKTYLVLDKDFAKAGAYGYASVVRKGERLFDTEMEALEALFEKKEKIWMDAVVQLAKLKLRLTLVHNALREMKV